MGETTDRLGTESENWMTDCACTVHSGEARHGGVEDGSVRSDGVATRGELPIEGIRVPQEGVVDRDGIRPRSTVRQ